MKGKKEQLLFKTLVGSNAYGTAVEGSDKDYKGVYAQHPEDLISFGYKEQKKINKDEEYYELRRFLQLAQSANPTILELLWMPQDCIEYCHPAFQYVIDHRDMFLTKECKNSFAGYAIQQIIKAKGLQKKMNWEKNRITKKNLIDFCYAYVDGKSVPLLEFLNTMGMTPENCGLVKIPHFRDGYNLYYSNNPELKYRGIESKNHMLKLSSVPKGENPVTMIMYNKDAFVIHQAEYKSYKTWLKERNVQRYIDIDNHGQKLDGKNMLHCIRLIDEAIEIVEQKTINIKRPNAEYLISIRKGQVKLNEILAQAEKGIERIKIAFENSNLPDKTNPDEVNQLLIEARRLIDWK